MKETRSFPCQLLVLSRLISVAISVSIWLSQTLKLTYTLSSSNAIQVSVRSVAGSRRLVPPE